MPTVRKLEPAEVETLEYKPKGQRKHTEEQYDGYLADFAIGAYGEAIIDEGEHRLTVRNRFKAAATRRGLTLEFRRTSDPLVRFKVAGNGHLDEQPQAAEPVPEPEPEPPPVPAKRKGRRPKKTA